jgi:hypothetical protein
MSYGDPSARPSRPPSPSGSVAATLQLDAAIQDASRSFKQIFSPDIDDGDIQKKLTLAWAIVKTAISEAGTEELKKRLRQEAEFDAYVEVENQGRELVKLLGRMAKQQVPWKLLFENGTLVSSL